MSIQEIEHAITQLSSEDVDRLAEWLLRFRGGANIPPSMPSHRTQPKTLADAMGGLLGAVGQDAVGAQTSSRDAGSAFTDHLQTKFSEGSKYGQ